MTSRVRRVAGASLTALMIVAVALTVLGSAAPAPALAIPAVDRPPTTVQFLWPLAGWPRVIGAFDPPAKPWLPGHRGVDLAAALRESVYAAGPGRVAFAGRVAGIDVVSIVHPGGLRTTYEPVLAVVHAGAVVAAGARIGTISARLPHCPVGFAACLHWGLIRDGGYLDPLSLLGLGQVRLKPTAGLH